MGEYTPISRAGRRSSFGDTVEVLQLWRLRLIGWFDTPTPSGSGLFKWWQFEPEVILLAVG